MSEEKKKRLPTEKGDYLNSFLQNWVTKGIDQLIPEDEEIRVVSHSLAVRTKEYPLGYTIDILGVDSCGDTRIEFYKNDPDIEPEDRKVVIIHKNP